MYYKILIIFLATSGQPISEIHYPQTFRTLAACQFMIDSATFRSYLAQRRAEANCVETPLGGPLQGPGGLGGGGLTGVPQGNVLHPDRQSPFIPAASSVSRSRP